jgi:Holliday junction DNA helicase RuvB
LGKTTLASIIAAEMGKKIHLTSGPTLETAEQLRQVLANVGFGDVLFVDEIHQLGREFEEVLYPAMEDSKIDRIIDGRAVRISLPKFTVIGATTRAGMLSKPLMTRFPIHEHLDYYEPEDLASIVDRSAGLLNIEISSNGALEIGRRARGTARIANNLLCRVRDFAQCGNFAQISKSVANEALNMLEIDGDGLDAMDKRILGAVITKFGGGPVGVNALSVAVGEEPSTISEVYEPYLIVKGYLNRTPRGRIASEAAYSKLNLTPKEAQPMVKLF